MDFWPGLEIIFTTNVLRKKDFRSLDSRAGVPPAGVNLVMSGETPARRLIYCRISIHGLGAVGFDQIKSFATCK